MTPAAKAWQSILGDIPDVRAADVGSCLVGSLTMNPDLAPNAETTKRSQRADGRTLPKAFWRISRVYPSRSPASAGRAASYPARPHTRKISEAASATAMFSPSPLSATYQFHFILIVPPVRLGYRIRPAAGHHHVRLFGKEKGRVALVIAHLAHMGEIIAAETPYTPAPESAGRCP